LGKKRKNRKTFFRKHFPPLKYISFCSSLKIYFLMILPVWDVTTAASKQTYGIYT